MEIIPNKSGVVLAVDPNSESARLGLQPGDRIVAINGQAVRDVIDYQYHASEGLWDLVVERNGARIQLGVDLDEEAASLTFEAPTGDGIRTCANKCPFCFLKGLPRGLRKSLYIKDDDFRYSFLYGNFITLTNFTEDDWHRLDEQRLSPLYVSVHATEPDVHQLMLGSIKAPDIMEQLRRFARLGIKAHTQVVLCPDLNDGAHLDRTIEDLAGLYPTVQSIAVVPVGLTPRHGQYKSLVPLRLFTDDESRTLLRQLEPYQKRFRKAVGRTLVYASDEWYFHAGQPVPPARFYDGFPQYQNGVGMVRDLLNGWSKAVRRLERRRRLKHQGRLLLLSGTLIAPVLKSMVDQIRAVAGAEIELLPVENRFFGETITVSGLLAGSDVLRVLQDRQKPDMLVLPRAMLDRPGERLIDDITPAQLESDLGCQVLFLESPAQLV